MTNEENCSWCSALLNLQHDSFLIKQTMGYEKIFCCMKCFFSYEKEVSFYDTINEIEIIDITKKDFNFQRKEEK